MKNKLINLKLNKDEPTKSRQQPVHVAMRKQKLNQKHNRRRDGVENMWIVKIVKVKQFNKVKN